MSRLYTLTEDNYKDVVKRLQKYCNKWRFLRRDTTYRVSGRNKKDNYPDSAISFQSKSWGYRRKFVIQKGNLVPNITMEMVFVENDSFIVPKEHNFKIRHDNNLFDYYDMWEDYKPLIHITTGSLNTIVLTYGDTVLFTKYGFTICTDNSYTDEPYLFVYKYEFIIHKPDGRILDYDEEIYTLQKDIIEDARLQDKRDMANYDYNYYE